MPIISPWFFYLTGLVDNLEIIFLTSYLIGIVSGVIYFIAWITDDYIDPPIQPKIIKKIGWFLGIVLLINVFMPSSTTCYQMLIANMTTVENIEAATEAGKDGIEWIIEAITEAGKELNEMEE